MNKAANIVAGLKGFDFRSLIDDFRNLNPNDPGSWPLAPKIAILFSLFVVILAAG